jgi:pyridoxine 5-phosphate synthase
MTKLSVNINKIATIRNARGGNNPNLLQMAKDIQSYGAQGITIHPRPDQRHITYKDAIDLPEIISTEFNIEGNPFLLVYNFGVLFPPLVSFFILYNPWNGCETHI